MTARLVRDRAASSTAAIRRVVLGIAFRTLGILALDFLLVRIWAPALVNRHQDLALAGGIVCVLLAILATGWLAFQLWADVRRLRQARHLAALPHIRRIED